MSIFTHPAKNMILTLIDCCTHTHNYATQVNVEEIHDSHITQISSIHSTEGRREGKGEERERERERGGGGEIGREREPEGERERERYLDWKPVQ